MDFSEKIKEIVYGDQMTPLPAGITAVLFIMLLIGSMTVTMVFSFLPQLIKSFGVSEVDTGRYAGIIGSSLFAGRVLSSMLWGYLADIKSKKMTTIASATTLSFATLAFGFSSHFNWALIARLLQGCFMGINVVIKAFMADICDDTNQGFGMTLLMCSYSTGLILGPSIGAFLAFPALQYPKLFSKESFFGRFAILLPHIFVVVCFIAIIPTAVYILPDDKSKQNKTARKQSVDLTEKIKEISQDNGCDLKDADEHYYTTSFTENEQILNRKSKKKQYLSINTLEHSTEENNCYNGTLLRESKLVKCIRQKPCLLSCLLYGSYAIIAIGYDELFPIFAATSKKYGGFAFTTSNIGVSLLVVAAVSVVLEIPLATKLIAKYGAKRVFIACTMLQSFLFPMHVVLTQISNTIINNCCCIFKQFCGS